MAEIKDIDLSKLSKEEKIALYEAIQAKKERKRKKGDIFKPHPGQEKILRSKAVEKFVFSGNGFGKTALTTNWVKSRMEGHCSLTNRRFPVPNRTILVLDAPSKLMDQWLPELQKWTFINEDHLKKDGKPYYRRIISSVGSEVVVMFHDQEPMLFESIEADYICFDEPPPEKVYNALRRGQRKLGSQPELLMVGTPISQPWLRKKIYEPWSKGKLNGVECFFGSTEENKKNLNWEAQARYFESLSEHERKIRQEGIFFDLEGLALAGLFDREIHVVPDFEPPHEWPVVVAIDPHPRKAHTAVAVAKSEYGQLYVIGTLTSKSAPKQFTGELMNFILGLNIRDIVCDSLGATPMSGGDGNKSFIDVMNEILPVGIRVRATSFKEKSDEDFIQKIQQVLELPVETDGFGQRLPLLQIFESCEPLIRDIENVTWKKNKLTGEVMPKLEIGDKDYLSCLKYALATNIAVRRRPKAHRYNASPWGTKKA